MKKLLLLLCCILLLLQSGCWNKRELESLGYVSAIALDVNDNKEIECYFSILKASEAAGGGTAGGKKGGGAAQGRAEAFYHSTGRTIFEAIRNTLTESPRRLFFGQQMVLFISEKLAKNVDINDVFDIFLRDHEFRRQVKVFIISGSAYDLTNAQTLIEKSIAKEVDDIVAESNAIAKFPDVNINDFVKVLASEVPNPVAPIITTIEPLKIPETESIEKTIEVAGMGVFKRNRLVGKVDTITTRGYLWIKNKINSTVLVIHSPVDEKPVSIEIISNNTKISTDIVDDIPVFKVNVEAEANIAEEMGSGDLTKPEMIKEVEKRTAKVISAEIEKAAEVAQLGLKTDFLGLGEEVYRKETNWWKLHGKHWENIFPDVKIIPDVKVKIRRMGLESKPLEVK